MTLIMSSKKIVDEEKGPGAGTDLFTCVRIRHVPFSGSSILCFPGKVSKLFMERSILLIPFHGKQEVSAS
ncbi:hypothetical protein DCMF_20585 [Candidatus Formimonas warabiya]|uniref:Uncharacterized protein n=1 Tax=Formimonas warabiya TaxID=1761012 RepID=A0A3G1KWG2_FORW1|nr:hypothetical protein DCMF_20585 [Candidatus Formimonas warabiya]